MPGTSSNQPRDTVEPRDLITLLRDHHIDWFDTREQWLLAVRGFGGGNADVAPFMRCTPDALRPVYEHIRDNITRPCGLLRKDEYVVLWVPMHLDCERQCLPITKMRIVKGIVYAIA